MFLKHFILYSVLPEAVRGTAARVNSPLLPCGTHRSIQSHLPLLQFAAQLVIGVVLIVFFSVPLLILPHPTLQLLVREAPKKSQEFVISQVYLTPSYAPAFTLSGSCMARFSISCGLQSAAIQCHYYISVWIIHFFHKLHAHDTFSHTLFNNMTMLKNLDTAKS